MRTRRSRSSSNKGVGGSGFQITTKKLKPAARAEVKAALDKKFGDGPNVPGTKDFSTTSIGPTFGKTVADSAIIAIIASLLVISAYIALRFEWKYAVPVLIALMHDLLITAGMYSLTGREVTTATVAALLTILGYSLYDTIIVFDRVRENVPRMPSAAFSQIVNRSMSEVLTRSLATSFCTLLPVLALLLFGGATLKDFAFALMVGIASGAYSSIFIASPVLTHWKEREGAYRQRRARIVRELGAVPAYATAAGRAGRRGARAEAPAHAAGQPDRTGGGGRAALPQRVPGTGAATWTSRESPAGKAARSGRAGVAQRRHRRRPSAAPTGARASRRRQDQRDPAADLAPEDLVLKDKPERARNAGGRATVVTAGRGDGQRCEGRDLGPWGRDADRDARLGDDGARDLALHDLPAGPFLGRDRGRVCGLADRRDRGRADHLRRESRRAEDAGSEGDRHHRGAVRRSRRADRHRGGYFEGMRRERGFVQPSP